MAREMRLKPGKFYRFDGGESAVFETLYYTTGTAQPQDCANDGAGQMTAMRVRVLAHSDPSGWCGNTKAGQTSKVYVGSNCDNSSVEITEAEAAFHMLRGGLLAPKKP